MSGIIADNTGRASGLLKAAAGGGAMEFINGSTFTTAANFIVSSFGSGFDLHRLIVNYQRISGSGNNPMLITLSTAGSYVSSNYHWFMIGGSSNNSTNAGKAVEDDAEWEAFRDGARYAYDFTLDFHFGSLTHSGTGAYKSMYGTCHSQNADATTRHHQNYLSGYNTNFTTACDAIKFAVTSGTLTGSYSLYGYKKS